MPSLDEQKTAVALDAKDRKLQQPSLEPGLRVSFFFDGTGNNLDADLPTQEHSNVARLYRAHRANSSQGLFRYYIPGLGTYFEEVGDPGNEMRGNGGGYRGEDRLQWAMSRLKSCLTSNNGRQTIHLALFGFSRGAALARAFAVRIAKSCQRQGDGSWRFVLGQRTFPVRLYFMGLFDSVASVGVPMGMNNVDSLVKGFGSTLLAMQNRKGSDLGRLAFGNAPGADPSPGRYTGHMAWANELRIPEMVEDCLHMVAAHEVRNSFPVDSVLQGQSYPSNCREMVYPGAHSDVGGGYRVGEGGRSRSTGSLLSMIPLRVMRAQAIQAGVPLDDSVNAQDFAEDSASRESFDLLHQRFTTYMNTVGWGDEPLGKVILAHMERYFQWRFHKIARDQKDRSAGRPTKDEALLRQFQGGWLSEKKALSKEMEPVRNRYFAQAERTNTLKNAVNAKSNQTRIRDEMARLDAAANEYFSLKARMDTLPGLDDSFLDCVRLYDTQLLADAWMLQQLSWSKGRANLRPHYQRLLNAYEAEQRGRGLRDMAIIQFFDTYVHDSLAGFAMDSTLPSDPRVIFTGGNTKLPYAMNSLPGQRPSRSALG
ncbi:T6SS phospholipase effector Tle1-like catalytic domain-containing protein [Cystobacter fuscus]|uniref:T6SS phospholipase effector Tle1-like catalytic domain-containing protein n=1 Tax=Cystobacter fuscus TaxID=43 RepID=UPI0037BE70DA